MLENIKSLYFIKKLFSRVDERKKLKVVKYNKSIQKNINISIINYIHFRGKYIIYESKGRGKEYNKYDGLIYEGEYLNGERNGRGKEYENKKLIYEGEYLNGERNGEGKEYGWKGKLKFSGEYLNGKILIGTRYDKDNKRYYIDFKRGKGKEYDYYDDLIFEGEYLDGKRNGKGKDYYNGKLIFEGEYKYDKKWNGKGYDKNGNII